MFCFSFGATNTTIDVVSSVSKTNHPKSNQTKHHPLSCRHHRRRRHHHYHHRSYSFVSQVERNILSILQDIRIDMSFAFRACIHHIHISRQFHFIYLHKRSKFCVLSVLLVFFYKGKRKENMSVEKFYYLNYPLEIELIR